MQLDLYGMDHFFDSAENKVAIDNSLSNDMGKQEEKIRYHEHSMRLVENEKLDHEIGVAKDAFKFVTKILKKVGKGAKSLEVFFKTDAVFLPFIQKIISKVKVPGTVVKVAIDAVLLYNIHNKRNLINEEIAYQTLVDKEKACLAIQQKQRKITIAIAESCAKITKFVLKWIRMFFEKAHPVACQLKKVRGVLGLALDLWCLKGVVEETKGLYKEYQAIREAQKQVALELQNSSNTPELNQSLRVRQIFLRSVHMRKWFEKTFNNLLTYAFIFLGVINSIGTICVLSGGVFAAASSLAFYLFLVSTLFFIVAWLVDYLYFGATDLDAIDPGGKNKERLRSLSEMNELVQSIYKATWNIEKIALGQDNDVNIEGLENSLCTRLHELGKQSIKLNEKNQLDDFNAYLQNLLIDNIDNKTLSQVEEVIELNDRLQNYYKLIKPISHLELKNKHGVDIKRLENKLISDFKYFGVHIHLGSKLMDQRHQIQYLGEQLREKEESFRRNLFARFHSNKWEGLQLAKTLGDDRIRDLLEVG